MSTLIWHFLNGIGKYTIDDQNITTIVFGLKFKKFLTPFMRLLNGECLKNKEIIVWTIKLNSPSQLDDFFEQLGFIGCQLIKTRRKSLFVRERLQTKYRDSSRTFVHLVNLYEAQLLFRLQKIPKDQLTSFFNEKIELYDTDEMSDYFKDFNFDTYLPSITEYLKFRDGEYNLKRGDIMAFEFVDYNEGLAIYDRSKLYSLSEIDENRDSEFNTTYIPLDFKIILEFPILYWSEIIINNCFLWFPSGLPIIPGQIMSLPKNFSLQDFACKLDGFHYGYCQTIYNGITYTIISLCKSHRPTLEECTLPLNYKPLIMEYIDLTDFDYSITTPICTILCRIIEG